MNRTQRLLVYIVGVMGILGATFDVHASNEKNQSSFTFPSDPISFQSAPGSQIATTYCLICHSAEYIYMQPPHSREKWGEIVRKMKRNFGCPIPESDIPTLITYLTSQNEIQPKAEFQGMKEVTDVSPIEKATSSSADSSKGKRVFATYCVNCHGQSGKGDGPIGKSLVPPAANLTLLSKKSDKEILQTIQKGRPGTAMPSWKNDLSSQEIHNVLAFIRTLTP